MKKPWVVGHLTRSQSVGLVLALSLVQSGCAATPSPAQAASEKTAPYYQDAQLCRAKSPAKPLPKGVDPAVALDTTAYLGCMTRLGYQQEAKTDPLLVALRKCQQLGTTSVTASGSSSVRPPRPGDVRDCLKSRGFPSTGLPPAAVVSGPAVTPTPPASARAPKSMLKNVPPASAVGQDDRQRIQTIYIPRKGTQPQ